MSTIELLLGLQERDIRIRDIQQQLKDIPERKKLEEARLDDLKQAVASADDALKAKLSEAKQLELDIESRKEKMATLRTQQMSLKTNQEFKAMDKEIEKIEHDISGIEDSQLICMSDIEAARSKHSIHAESLKGEEGRVNADLSIWDEQCSRLEGEVKGIQDEREAAAKEIDAREFLARYETIIARKNPAIVPLENGICGGCHMQLPPYVAHDVRKHTGPVSCVFCARLLYFRG